MTNVQPFLDGAASIDPSMLDGVKALAETILILTAANILEGRLRGLLVEVRSPDLLKRWFPLVKQ